MSEYVYKEVNISDLKELLKKHDVEVDSPDGYVPVGEYVEKGKKDIYLLKINGNVIKASNDHLFETNEGWVMSVNLDSNKHKILCDDGQFHNFTCEKTNTREEVVDLQIQHENHRYYTNGVSSHNTNVGKTLVQCAFGCNALLDNKNVLYVTFEEDEKKISKRFVSNLLDIEINNLKLISREKLQKKHEMVKKRLEHKLIIKEYPEGTISANHIRNLLSELHNKKKFKPDILFVDYIGCMVPNGKPNANMNSNDTLRLITGQVRAIGMEFGIPVISAMQANRGGIGSAELDLTDAADSIGQAFKADAIFSLTQTDELKEAGMYNCSLIKSRFGMNRCRFSLGVDIPKMRLYDVEEDEGYVPSEKPTLPSGVEKKDIVDDAAVAVHNQLKNNKEDKRRKMMGLDFK